MFNSSPICTKKYPAVEAPSHSGTEVSVIKVSVIKVSIIKVSIIESVPT